MAAAALVGGLALAACTAARVAPPGPSLPAVHFVPPCDPQASVGLTAQGVDQLKARDAAWHAYVDQLRAMLLDER